MQRHDFDPIAFIFGVIFAGLGVVYMSGRLELLNHAQWLWPGLLVLLGLAVLVGARGRGGARATTRPAFEPGSRIDPAVEDDPLHSPMRTIDSEHLADTGSLFTLQRGARTPEAATGTAEAGAASPRPEEPSAAEPEEAQARTEVLPQVDQEADTELLPPRPQARDEREEDESQVPRPPPDA